MEEVWIKTEPVHVDSTAYFDIKCEDGIGTHKTEPTTPVVSFTVEEVCSEAVSIPSEITFSEYECTPPNVVVQLTKNDQQNCSDNRSPETIVHSTENAQVDIKSEDGAGIVKTEPTTSTVCFTVDEGCSEGVSIPSEITFSGYECTPQNVAVHVTKNDKPESEETNARVKTFHSVECGGRFARSTHLEEHKRKHTGEKPFGCDICGTRFAYRSILIYHKRTHTGEKPFSCEVCGKKFALNTNLTRHKQRHTKRAETNARVKIFHCEECGAQCTNNHKLAEHKRRHTGEKPFGCDICGEAFVSKSILVIHMYTHGGGIKPHACDICESTFAFMYMLNKHKRVHTGEKPFSCEVCGKKYALKSYLKGHQRIHTGERGERPFGCDICGKALVSKQSLIRHMYTHSGKPYACDVCGTQFTQRGLLTAHNRIHTGEKPFSCEVCGKKFALKRYLRDHKRRHTREQYKSAETNPHSMENNEFDIKCEDGGDTVKNEPTTPVVYFTAEEVCLEDVCIKSEITLNEYECTPQDIAVQLTKNDEQNSKASENMFSFIERGACKNSLQRHKKIHTAKQPKSAETVAIVKKFHCVECGKRFDNRSAFETHQRKHTGEKPFGCDICGKAFVLKSILIGHMYTHTEKRYSCDICGARFIQRCRLTDHIRIHTGERPFS